MSDVSTVEVADDSLKAVGEPVVLRWRRRGAVWEGLVSREVDGRATTEWLPALVLPGRMTLPTCLRAVEAAGSPSLWIPVVGGTTSSGLG